MFIKPFKVKNNVQLKATEKKKFRSKISLQFPSITEDYLNEILPSKSNVCTIKIIAHNGTQSIVYAVDKRPMFFEIEDKLYPTVYTLWIAKDFIPEFTTHPQVFPKLSNGADLMLPGVVRKETTLASWGRFQKDEVVAVNLTSNKAGIGVGSLARSSEDLYMSAGSGICVKMLHVYGDKLWSMEPTVCLQVPNFDAIVTLPKKDDFPSLADSMSKTKITEKKVEVPVEVPVVGPDAEIIVDDNKEMIEEIKEQEESIVLSPTEEMDLILKNAFLTCLKISKDKLILPLLTSNFYRLHILPSTQTPIDIKLTSYKKVSKFLSKMSDEGYLTVREETKGVEKVVDIDYNHPELLTFRPEKIIKSTANEQTDEIPLFSSSVSELVAITDDSLEFFSYFKLPKGKSMEEKDALRYIKEYLGQKKIKPDPITKIFTLDEVLTKICGSSQVNSVSTIHSNLLSKMDLCYEMRSQQLQKQTGKIQPIQMNLATRSGNKKVTLISNLELYGIIIGEFAKACKIGAAASTTIIRPPGSKTDVLQIQGNQVKLIFDILTKTYKIQPKNITGLELARKEKKKK